MTRRYIAKLLSASSCFAAGGLRVILPLLIVAASVAMPTGAFAVDLKDANLYGYFSLEYVKATNSQGDVNGSFNQSQFNILGDFPVTDRLAVKAHVEFGHGGAAYGTGAVRSGRAIETKIDYVFAEYYFLESARLQMGKVFTPFGLMNEIHDSRPAILTVEVPQLLYESAEYGGHYFMPEWNTGFQLHGAAFESGSMLLEYNLYIGNGENIPANNPAIIDDNIDKALGGRLTATFDGEDQIALSFYRGARYFGNSENRDHQSFGLSARKYLGNFEILAEGFISQLGNQHQWAANGRVMYSIGGIYNPYIQYERLNPGSKSGDDFWQDMMVGINLHLMRQFFLKFEWHENTRGKNNPYVSNGKGHYGEFRSQVAVMF